MDGSLKLDLHTHCREAIASPTPTLDIAKRIVDAVKGKGLDGIAITDHNIDYFGYEVKELIEQKLNGEIIVIPGKEIDKMLSGPMRGFIHLVELYLPGDVTFRYISHPGHPYVKNLESLIDSDIHGIEIKNALHNGEINESKVRELADKYDLILLTNSDAHDLEDIGRFYNNIKIEELRAKAKGN